MNYKDILAMAEAYKGVAKKEAMDPVDTKELKGKHKDRKDKDIDNDGDVDKSDEYLHKRRKAVSTSIKGKKKDQEVETEVQEMTKTQKRALQNIKAQPKDKVSLKKAPWDMKKEEVEHLEELTAAEKKLIGQMYDKKGNLTPLGKKVMDHGKAASKLTPKDAAADNARRKEYNAYQKSKRNEEVELDEATATVKQQKALKALMTKALDGKRAKPGTTSSIASNGDFVVSDGSGRIIGRLKAGTYTDPLKETVEEAKDHGNMNNGSPAGEGLSPSAKKELDRTTPMNPATDAEAVNNINFKTFKAMSKKAAMRSNDNAQGDKTPPKAGK